MADCLICLLNNIYVNMSVIMSVDMSTYMSVHMSVNMSVDMSHGWLSNMSTNMSVGWMLAGSSLLATASTKQQKFLLGWNLRTAKKLISKSNFQLWVLIRLVRHRRELGNYP